VAWTQVKCAGGSRRGGGRRTTFRYARTWFALDALDSHAATPDDPERLVPNPAKKAAAAQARQAEAAEAERDARLLELRGPPPATRSPSPTR
jgi:hypothetical protein